LQPKFSQCQNPIVEGLMGRPLKPQKLHVLHGTNRKDRDTKREGELMLAAGDVGECPAWFRPVSREEWARITGDQQYRQILAPAHRGLLIEYCTLHARMIRDSMGKREKTAKPGVTRSPLSTSERQMLNSLRMQLGITPASQGKVKGPKVEAPKSKWDEQA